MKINVIFRNYFYTKESVETSSSWNHLEIICIVKYVAEKFLFLLPYILVYKLRNLSQIKILHRQFVL